VNRLTIKPARLALLRKVCLSLPQTTEKVAWGDPTWRIRDRIFAMQKGNVAGHRPSLWLKARRGVQASLVAADPVRFFVPPYVGEQGWIGIYLDGPIDWAELADQVEESFWLVAPKRLDAKLVAAPPKPRAKPRARSRPRSRN
jgi:predicted DNA-binding protein (MmcQ/YjbR family)